MDRLPPLRLLTVFETVERHGSMRAAAGILNVSLPAVSQSLKSLEDHVGVALFDRSSRPVQLTSAGQLLATSVREGIGLIAESIDSIRAMAADQDRALTVACTVGMATHWLMPRLSAFYGEHPEILINVQAMPSDLNRPTPGMDMLLRYGDGRWSEGRTQVLFPERICPVGKPELVEKMLRQDAEITSAPLIHVEFEGARHWAGWAEYCRARGLPSPPRRGMRFNTYVQAVQAALAGQGLMLGWRSITDQLVADERLVQWPDGEIDLGTAYYLTVMPQAERHPACGLFTEWLLAKGADHQP
ncbi:LysR substrate-binding domain-containing protein [Paracoccus sp. MBLB3053]|uniref:LysR substrate-binding domain-containing protein n=1 Tax=Paracoccus aurantius TaxID=3073814 RepID=A0ABU2HW70_9RHOB|nr:LysR substrate-binding domain-containing protein [Paracoccus sp. MBLB3053]MDS9469312.1 LysR substrate-binding domain-containing protein [Paracoccus sp. MBLB3053]